MLYFDPQGYPKSIDDSMDSAVRAGILTITGSQNYLLQNYIDNVGSMRRHPTEVPANNPRNCTRDQMLPLIAGFYAMANDEYLPNNSYYKQSIKKFFWRRFKSFFFMQNTERDRVNSVKYPFSHSFYKDSNPTPLTYPFYKGQVPSIEGVTIETKKFDGADPLMPNHIWFLIKAGRIYGLYPFALIGIPFFILTLIAHSFGDHNEENQMLAEAYVNGKLGLLLYKLINRKWKARSEKYWTERNEVEYHDMIVKFMEGK